MGIFTRWLLVSLLVVGGYHAVVASDESPAKDKEKVAVAAASKTCLHTDAGDRSLRRPGELDDSMPLVNDTSCNNATDDDQSEAETLKQNLTESDHQHPTNLSDQQPMEDSDQKPVQQPRNYSPQMLPQSHCPTTKSTCQPQVMEHQLSKSLSQFSELLQWLKKIGYRPEEKEKKKQKDNDKEQQGHGYAIKWFQDLQQQYGQPPKWLQELQQYGQPPKWLQDLQQYGHPPKWLQGFQQYGHLMKWPVNPQEHGKMPMLPQIPIPQHHGHQPQQYQDHGFLSHHEPPAYGFWLPVPVEPQRVHGFRPQGPVEPQRVHGFRPQGPVEPQRVHGFRPQGPVEPQRVHGFRPQGPVEPQRVHGFRPQGPVEPQRVHGFRPQGPVQPQYQHNPIVPVNLHEHGYMPIVPIEPQMPQEQERYQSHRASHHVARWPDYLPQKPNYMVIATKGYPKRPNYKPRQPSSLPRVVYRVAT
ncbi:uncharacterized protein LOC118559094 isoform X3 [Fundulus heteroclitus]|uniref:uncharacterized protein LOC118559094 isoform X3 n=1 Tax=Fundulus heteroclitus TaxID=8078 RepID=UPI00165BEFFE|nr:uncharacterized protein LOC118559094 isoform X3 [Fundulus heteroclitus]